MTPNADYGTRSEGRDVHYAACHGPLCPCYLAGLAAGDAEIRRLTAEVVWLRNKAARTIP